MKGPLERPLGKTAGKTAGRTAGRTTAKTVERTAGKDRWEGRTARRTAKTVWQDTWKDYFIAKDSHISRASTPRKITMLKHGAPGEIVVSLLFYYPWGHTNRNHKSGLPRWFRFFKPQSPQ